MSTEVLQQIGFQAPADCNQFNPKEIEHKGRKHYRHVRNCSLKSQCKNDLGLLHCLANGSTTVPSNVASGLGFSGNTAKSLLSLGDPGVSPSQNIIPLICPVVTICKEDVSPVFRSSYSQQADSLEPVGYTLFRGESGVKKRMHALDQKNERHVQDSGNEAIACTSSSAQDHFNSSFSFIQLSLNSALEASDLVIPSDCREPKGALKMRGIGKEENANLHVPAERQRTSGKALWASSYSRMCGGTADSDQLQECERLSLSHANAEFLCSTNSWNVASAGSSVTSGYGSSTNVSHHSWNSLMRQYEPALQDCLLGNQSILKIKSLIIKLKSLQEKAVVKEDYERANKFTRMLEELEKEKSLLTFQLPSWHPSICSFLDKVGAQVQMALYGDVHREETQLLQANEYKVFSIPYHEQIQISATKQHQLLEEKLWIQKEIEILKARLSVLEAKDQQLQRKIEERDQLIQVQDSELSKLLSCISLGELQATAKALADTSAGSRYLLCSLDFPEPIKRLQEKEHSLNLSVKDTAAQVCTSQKLCSSLRRKVNNIETTQLPALLEAKMFAISGGNFCTAKDLVEETKSLTAERERLERFLTEWLELNARNIQQLERMKEDYKSLKEEVDQGEAAFEKNLKKNALKYAEMLEKKLKSSDSQLLKRVWEVDLESCQLLIQGLQLKEGDCSVFEGEEKNQTDEEGARSDASLITKWRQSKDFPIKDLEWSKHQSAPREFKEEFNTVSTELKENCEKISEKLMHLEDQLQTALFNCDESLVPSLQREIQMVKETLQAMLVQLQPAKEAEDDAAGANFLRDSWCPGNRDFRE